MTTFRDVTLVRRFRRPHRRRRILGTRAKQHHELESQPAQPEPEHPNNRSIDGSLTTIRIPHGAQANTRGPRASRVVSVVAVVCDGRLHSGRVPMECGECH